MFSGPKLFYTFGDSIPPSEFPKIIHPHLAISKISGLSASDVLALFSGVSGSNAIRSSAGFNPYQTGANMRWLVQRGLTNGDIIAVDTHVAESGTAGLFYVNDKGHLRALGVAEPGYPTERIINRYEEMVSRHGRRARPTIFPSQVTKAREMQNGKDPSKGNGVSQQKIAEPLTKAQRWQERKYLIGRGERSPYPDAQIASKRLAENNIAVENAKLSENTYKTINPLKDTPGVPEGWKDISNDEAALKKLRLKSDMLYDNSASPDFLARVYQPDSNVFGTDMNPTVAFRGSRAPAFAEGTRDTINKILYEDVREIKNIKITNSADWINNGAQGAGMDSVYYKKAVEIGRALKNAPAAGISGHSLGGGMASAASLSSGKPAWTFNAAGLHSGTVEKYGGSVIGSADNIQAYRVKGELLTKLQETEAWDDAKDVYFHPLALASKETLSALAPDAVGIKHVLPGGTGSLLDMHGIDQAIRCIEEQKDDDIATIRSRI